MIGTSVGPYQIVAQLGQGGMGVVYRANDTRLDRPVALKFLPPGLSADPEAKERFMQEARTASGLDHPNICTIHDIGQSADGRLYIVMPFYEGQTLRERLEDGPLEAPLARDMVRQLAQGLEKAHAAAIVHRDLKPANIMLTSEGRAVILDFGVAKLGEGVDLTAEGSTLGTAAYMSPEQARGERVDARSDLWSVGVLLYEMLSGRRPFSGTYDAAIAYSVLNQEPDPLEGVPDDLGQLTERLLSKGVESRPKDATAILGVLDASSTEVYKPSARDERAELPVTGRRRLALMGAAGIVLLTALLLIWGSTGSKEPAPLATDARPSLAVLYFDNETEEDRLGRVVADMLSRSLARSEGLKVASSQRLMDILRDLDRGDDASLSASVASEVARRAGVETMLVGAIVQLGGTIRVDAELTDVETLTIIASVTGQATSLEGLFELVDRMTPDLEKALGAEPEGDLPSLAAVTTSSVPAYKAWQEGLELVSQWRFSDAAERFQEAVDRDPEFADAYIWLANATYFFATADPMRDLSEVRRLADLAIRHSADLPELERARIRQSASSLKLEGSDPEPFRRVAEARPDDRNVWYELGLSYYEVGLWELSKGAFERMLELDPTQRDAYNMLAYLNAYLGDPDAARSMARKYIALLPESGNSYDTAWEVAVTLRDIDEAVRVTTMAVERDPPITSSYWRRALAFGYTPDTTAALADVAAYAESVSNPEYNRGGFAARLRSHWGQSEAALTAQRTMFENARSDAEGLTAALRLGTLLHLNKRHSEAERVLREAAEFGARNYPDDFNPVPVVVAFRNAMGYLTSGDIRSAGPFTVRLNELLQDSTLDRRHREYALVLGIEQALQAGDIAAARQTMDGLTVFRKDNSPYLPWQEARVLAASDSVDAAVALLRDAEYEIRRSKYFVGDPVVFYRDSNLTEYRVGVLYEQAGRESEAIEAYQAALSRWAYYDSDIKERDDTRQRLARLQRTVG